MKSEQLSVPPVAKQPALTAAAKASKGGKAKGSADSKHKAKAAASVKAGVKKGSAGNKPKAAKASKHTKKAKAHAEHASTTDSTSSRTGAIVSASSCLCRQPRSAESTHS